MLTGARTAGLSLLLIWTTSGQPSATLAEERQLLAGAATVEVTPQQLPVIVNGGFLERATDKVADPLYARSLVLSSGDETVAMVVVDSCMIPRDVCDAAKAAAHQPTSIPAERILISATHTHSAPSVMDYCLGTSKDHTYTQQLIPQIAESITAAYARREPAEIGWTVVDAPQHTHCRRWIRRPDRVDTDPFGNATVRAMMHPGYQNADYLGPAGPADTEMTLLSVRSLQGRPICLLANYSMHYFGAQGGISADYFGLFASLMEQRLGGSAGDAGTERGSGCVAMMSQGTSGDLHWMDYTRPPRKLSMEQYAQQLAEIASAAYQQIEYRNRLVLKMEEQELELRRRLPDHDRLQWAREMNAARGARQVKNRPEVYARQAEWIHEHPTEKILLPALRIGDLGITGLPHEVFGITGLKLKAQSPLQPTFNIELANGAAGYIPPPEQHELGGYTTWPARTAGLEVQAEPKIVDAVLGLLEKVADQPRRPAEDDLYPAEIRTNIRRALGK